MRLAISALHWIVDINKAMLKTKSIGQMLAERLHAVAFGGMMPGRQIGNARLARQMRGGLADFAASVQISSRLNGVAEKTLRRARAPRHAANRALCIAKRERRAAKRVVHLRREGRERDWLRQGSNPSQFLIAKTAFRAHAQPLPKLRVIAELWMRIERQMVGKQVHAIRQQEAKTLIFPAADRQRLIFPEETVMYQRCIRAPGKRCLKPRLPGARMQRWYITVSSGKMSLCRSAAGNISVFAYCWRMACTCLPTICRSMRIQSSAITRSLGNGWACARKAVLAIRNWDGLEPCLSQSRSRPSRRR